jgi:hypothetical protein
MTFERSWRCLAHWWWVVGICVLAVAAVGFQAGGRTLSDAKATARVHVQDTVVAYSPATGEAVPYTPNRNVGDLTKGDFVDLQAAAAAVAALGLNSTASAFAGNLGFTALTGTDASLTYSAGGQADSSRRLTAYVDAFVAKRRQATARPLSATADLLSKPGGTSKAADRLRAAAGNVRQQIYQVGAITTSPATTLPTGLTVAAGAIAGLILGTILALLLGRFDPRITSAPDLRLGGLSVVEVNTRSAPRSIETVRALIEVGAVGRRVGSVAVATAGRAKHSGMARMIADSFASAGRPTAMLTSRGAFMKGDGGWIARDDGRVDDSLISVDRFADTVNRIRPEGGVVVIEVPALDEGPEGVVTIGASDVTVLVVYRNRTTWSQLERSFELLAAAEVSDSVLVCVDGAGRASRGEGEARQPGHAKARGLSSTAAPE